MVIYTVTGKVGQAGYLDIANSGDIAGKNIYVNMTNRCPCSCVFSAIIVRACTDP